MAIGLNRWRSLRAPFERTSWKSTAVEAPTFSLDAFAANAGFAALPWTRATARCITDYQGNVHEIPASAKPRNGVRVVRNLAQVSENLGVDPGRSHAPAQDADLP